MKKFLCITILLLVLANAFAQTKPKPKAKEKPPTQKEMADMMKEMQKEMDGMSEEDKKMMDSMGIKMPSMNSIPKVTDKQLAVAWEDGNRIVPKRDAARIATIPTGLTDARMETYIASIQKKMMATLDAKLLAMSEEIFNEIQARAKTNAEAGNMATAFWLSGQPEIAMYVLGKICTLDPKNNDNLNNYASILSMQGGQHLAIPVFNILNTKFPRNSTLLNNLGQAWFGLGEITKAEKYLDSAIAIYAYHPQANMTKAAIEESRGNIEKAREAIKKSIRHAYTKDKEDKLAKLGYKLKRENLRVPFKPGADPLGLEKTRRPDYPTSISQLNALLPQWRQFNNECDMNIQKLRKELAELTEKYGKTLPAQMMASVKNGVIPASAREPLFARKASLEMNERKAYHDIKIQKLGEKYMQLVADLDAINKNKRRPPPEDPCTSHRDAINEYLKNTNELKKLYDDEALNIFRHYLNDMAYWSQYTSTDANMFQIIKAEFEISWLKKNRELQPKDMERYAGVYADCVEEEENVKPFKLAEFDDIACQYKSKLDLTIFFIESNCSRMTSKFDFMFIKYNRMDDFQRAEGDEYIASTLAISAEAGKDIKAGPLKAEAKLGVGIELEMDRSGVKDVSLIAEAKAGAGTNVLDENESTESPGIGLMGKDAMPTTVEAGVEGRISLISGKGSVSGTGVLTGVKMSEW